MRSEIVIVGAGIAGLATAAAMARSGRQVCVLEQAAEITEVGAGLQISPNGSRVLAALGVPPGTAGDAARAVELRDHRGQLVQRMDLGDGFYLMHRADLIAALEGAARVSGVTVRLLQQVVDLEMAGRTAARTAQDASFEADLIVGADGLHSRLRAALGGAGQPFFTGQVAWRATIAGDDAAPVAQVFMGPGRHLVSYPLRGGQLRNIVAVEERDGWVAEGWHHRDDPAALRLAFADFGGPVGDWLEQVRAPHLWGLFRHPVAPRWTDGLGRMAILGDAAHPTLPFLAQGANLALEDAWTLAAALRDWSNRAEGLARWQTHRLPRARAVIEAANRNARAFHLRAPVAPVAHGLLRLGARLTPGAALRRFRWIHGYDATAV